ncbi:hypothetical protein V2G26_018301 [Clonostachys chloroleuca]
MGEFNIVWIICQFFGAVHIANSTLFPSLCQYLAPTTYWPIAYDTGAIFYWKNSPGLSPSRQNPSSTLRSLVFLLQLSQTALDFHFENFLRLVHIAIGLRR